MDYTIVLKDDEPIGKETVIDAVKTGLVGAFTDVMVMEHDDGSLGFTAVTRSSMLKLRKVVGVVSVETKGNKAQLNIYTTGATTIRFWLFSTLFLLFPPFLLFVLIGWFSQKTETHVRMNAVMDYVENNLAVTF